MQLSLRSLEDLQSKYEGMKSRVKNITAAAEDKVMTVVQSAEVGVTAFGFGVINGYWARPELLGVPVDGLTALGLHGVGFFMKPEVGRHLHNLGDGALSSWLTGVGVGIGTKMLQEKNAAAPRP